MRYKKTKNISFPIGGIGTVETDMKHQKLTVFEKPLTLSCFGVPNKKSVAQLKIDGKTVHFNQENDKIFFPKTAVCHTLLIEY